MKRTPALVGLIGAMLAATASLKCDPLDDWHWRSPSGGFPLRGIIFGNGAFVAVGYYGGILMSTDGAEWTAQTSPTLRPLHAITYGNGLFLAVGGSGIIMSSPDGRRWNVHRTNAAQTLRGVAHGGDAFVAVGSDGVILSSSDGRNWNSQNSGTTNWLLGISYVNGSFLAVGERGTILQSSDAVQWSNRASRTTWPLHATTYGSGVFVVVGSAGTILRSTNAVFWEDISSDGAGDLRGVAYVNSRFVAVGDLGVIETSTNAFSSKRRYYAPRGLFGIANGLGLFVAVGQWGSRFTSSDGIIWEDHSAPISSTLSLNGICHGASKFVAVGTGGTVITSPDGAAWVNRASGTSSSLHGVTFSPNGFVAVGDNETIIASIDGATWSTRHSGPANILWDIAFGNGRHVVVGAPAEIGDPITLTSVDGVAWTRHNTGYLLRSIAFGEGAFVAVSPSGKILTSNDGAGWIERSSPVSDLWRSVTYAEGRFVAVGDGVIVTSTDGVTWERGGVGGGNAVAYGEGVFVATGGSAGIFASITGKNWIRTEAELVHTVNGLAFGNNSFVAVGGAGAIIQSKPLNPFRDASAQTAVETMSLLDVTAAQCSPLSSSLESLREIEDDTGNKIELFCEPRALIFRAQYRLYYTPRGGQRIWIGQCPLESGSNWATLDHSGDRNGNQRIDFFIQSRWISVDQQYGDRDDDDDGKIDIWEYTYDFARGVRSEHNFEIGSPIVLVYSNATATPGETDFVPGPQPASDSDLPMRPRATAECDLDADGDCDREDRALFEYSYGLCFGQVSYNPLIDLNSDGCVDTVDFERLFAPPVLGIRRRHGDLLVVWNGVLGKTYGLEYKDSLDLTPWSALKTAFATNSLITISDSISNSVQRFYRLRVLP